MSYLRPADLVMSVGGGGGYSGGGGVTMRSAGLQGAAKTAYQVPQLRLLMSANRPHLEERQLSCVLAFHS